ncbi:MAG: Dickkopf N-terminal cysteine-rich domain-containing protein [Myxococcota bacterium]
MTTTTLRTRCWVTAAVAVLCCAGCGTTVVGSRYVKSQDVEASKGAVLAVTAEDSTQLAGTKLEIPAAALDADTTITLELGADSLVAEELVAGPVAIWGPAGTHFKQPARMTLPLNQLEAGEELSIFVREADGRTFEIPASGVVVDAAAGTVSFDIAGFTRFQPLRRRPCTTNSDCRQGLACVNGRCRPTTSGCQADSDCPPGFVCTQATTNSMGGVCQPQPPQCQNCPPGVACINGACAVTCGNVVSCPPGSQCINGACSVPCGAGTTGNVCPSGQVCDPSRGCVVPPAQCGSNSTTPNCPPGSQCINGACVALCNPNTICPQGLTCDANRGLCVPIGPPTRQCNASNDCPNNEACINGVCVSACGSAGATCPTGTVCDAATGQCVPGNPPPPACTNSAGSMGCPNNEACINGVCVPSCGPGVACPQGTQCDPMRGVCVPGTPGACSSGQLCGPGHVCVGTQCLPVCNASGSTVCANGEVCDPNLGACVPAPTGCGMNVSCAPGQVCVAGQCVAACNAAGTVGCPTGEVCDPQTGRCVPGNPGQCGANSQCAQGQVCISGQCLAACNAMGTIGCAPGTVCDPSTGACVPGTPGTCSSGQLCGPGQVCVGTQCVPVCNSTSGVTCPSGTRCDATTGQCVPVNPSCGSAGAVCATGQVCVNGQCRAACTSAMDCAPNQQCVMTPGAVGYCQ